MSLFYAMKKGAAPLATPNIIEPKKEGTCLLFLFTKDSFNLIRRIVLNHHNPSYEVKIWC